MANFMVHIQLHEPKDDDYTKLHQAMEDKGFFRTIDVGGVRSDLPHATYHLTSNSSCRAVRDLAEQVATQINKKPKIVVAEYTKCESSGLTPSKPEPGSKLYPRLMVRVVKSREAQTQADQC